MDLDEKLILKVQFGDEIRKMPIHNDDITYDELIIMMERVFKHKLNQCDEIVIKYKDEDTDLITITDDSDLSFAIESSEVLKLVISVSNKEEESEINEEKLNSIDLQIIRRELQAVRDTVNKLLDKLSRLNNGAQSSIKEFRASSRDASVPLSIDNQTHSKVLISNVHEEDKNAKTQRSPSNDIPHERQRPSPTRTNLHSIPQPIPSHSDHMMRQPNMLHSSMLAHNLPPSSLPPQRFAGPISPPSNIDGPTMHPPPHVSGYAAHHTAWNPTTTQTNQARQNAAVKGSIQPSMHTIGSPYFLAQGDQPFDPQIQPPQNSPYRYALNK